MGCEFQPGIPTALRLLKVNMYFKIVIYKICFEKKYSKKKKKNSKQDATCVCVGLHLSKYEREKSFIYIFSLTVISRIETTIYLSLKNC